MKSKTTVNHQDDRDRFIACLSSVARMLALVLRSCHHTREARYAEWVARADLVIKS